ncbi:unnamed protein product [Blepharisma stoltei]|uniref:Uncharacterized protein n=1 Tax=Blepharisma stoltei TaxID=1481888 RepID=A0AAU9JEM5_9CILI|nr:unnamed protein product [Blepharisma stoltei]
MQHSSKLGSPGTQNSKNRSKKHLSNDLQNSCTRKIYSPSRDKFNDNARIASYGHSGDEDQLFGQNLTPRSDQTLKNVETMWFESELTKIINELNGFAPNKTRLESMPSVILEKIRAMKSNERILQQKLDEMMNNANYKNPNYRGNEEVFKNKIIEKYQKKINELKQSLQKKYQEEINELKQILEQKEAILNSQESTMKDYWDRAVELKNRCAELQKENDIIKSRNEQHLSRSPNRNNVESKTETIEKIYRDLETSNLALERENNRLKEKIQNLSNQSVEKSNIWRKSELENKRSNNDMLKKEIKDLKQELTALTEDKRQLINSENNYKRKIEKLQKEIKENSQIPNIGILENNLSKASSVINELQEKSHNLEECNSQLSKQNEDLRSEIIDLKLKLAGSESNSNLYLTSKINYDRLLSESKSEKNRYERLIKELREEIEKLNRELHSSNQSKKELQKKNDDYWQNFNQALNDIAANEADIKRLKDDLESKDLIIRRYIKEVQSLENDKIKLIEQINSYENIRLRAETELYPLNQKIKTLEIENRRFAQENSNLRENAKELETDIKQAKNLLNENQSIKQKIKDQNSELEAKIIANEGLRKELSELNNKLAEETSKNQILSTQLKKLQYDSKASANTIGDLTKRNESLQSQLKKQSEENSNLKEAIDDLRNEFLTECERSKKVENKIEMIVEKISNYEEIEIGHTIDGGLDDLALAVNKIIKKIISLNNEIDKDGMEIKELSYKNDSLLNEINRLKI